VPGREKFPLNKGVLSGPYLVIPECVLCGLPHYHGAGAHGPDRHKVGEITFRVPHCIYRGANREFCNYAIEIVEEVREGTLIPGKSRKRRPREMSTPPFYFIPAGGMS
jgi:hypothetical protein